MSEQDHQGRLSAVETRTKTLEDNFTAFTNQYGQDRKEDKHDKDLMFSKLNAISSSMSEMQGTRGRVPMAFIVTVIALVPAITVPIVTLFGAFVWQAVNPLSETLAEERMERRIEHDQHVETRISQARLEERQKFILQAQGYSYGPTK